MAQRTRQMTTQMTTGDHVGEMAKAVAMGVGFAFLIGWAMTLFLVFLGAFVLAL